MQPEVKKLWGSFIVPFIMVLAIIGVKLAEKYMPSSFVIYGVLPRHIEGLKGILAAPFIHADWEHLASNAVPLLVLGAALFYFYREVAWRVLLIIYIMSGFWLWLGGRENYHIGASNIVYGLASFLFLSGIIRKHIGLIAISLLVVFLYGSMVWGLLPVLQKISWEGHLFGTLAGILCAYSFRKEGTQRKRYEWEFEEDDDTPPPVNEATESPLRVIYTFRESDKNKEDEPGKN